MAGFIKIHRRMMKWGWYTDANTFRVFMHLLLLAQFEEHEYRCVELKPGQLICGRKQIAKDLNISEQNVKTALNHLKSTNEITIKPTNKYSVITIEKWRLYQDCDDNANQQTNQQANQQLTNNQPTTNQQLTTYKNEKNVKNEKNIYRDVPEELKKSFMAWADMRKKIKKPITTAETVKRALLRLDKLADTAEKKNELIQLATDMCWQRFYLPKPEQEPPKAPKLYKAEPEVAAEEMPEEVRANIEKLMGKMSYQ